MESNNLVDIPNYDNYKFDLDLLQVYNLKYNRYLKNRLCGTNYYRVSLCKNGKAQNFEIHRLVYMINKPTEDISDYQIDHIDGNPQNNNINNLRKCYQSDNMSNRKTNKNNKLGIKNIVKSQSGYRFQLVKNKIRYSKNFKNLQDAIDYRDKFVLEKCGEFANLG